MRRQVARGGPSPTELKLRAELDRVRRVLNKIRKSGDAALAAEVAAAEAAAATAAASPTEDEVISAPAEPGAPVVATNAAPSEDVAELRQKVQELETTRERLSKLYFAQLDENRRRSAELHQILRVVSEINADLDLDTLIQRIATTIQSSLGYRTVLIRLRTPGTAQLRAVAFAGLGDASRATLQAEDVPVEDFESWLKHEFCVSRSYFISHKSPFNSSLPAGIVANLGPREDWEWHAEDILLVPLRSASGELVAYFSVDDPVDRLVPSRGSIELLEMFGSHALVAIENARLYRALEDRSRELESASQRMNEINVLKDNFVSTVSHELLTPVTTIRAFIDALRASPAEDIDRERMTRLIDVLNEETQRLSRLIVSILDLSRFDSGTPSNVHQPVDLVELLGETTQVLGPMAEAGQVNLKVINELADTRLDADRDQIRQLLLHLGNNAIKFTPAGGSVQVRLSGDDRSVKLQVEDTGIGIPAPALDKVFDRFYQVDSSLVRQYGGVGLGLALCKSIVEWHGGRIHATSEPEKGSCFTAVLPRRGAARVVVRAGLGSAAGVDLVKLAIEMVAEVMNAGVVSMMTVQPDNELAIQAAIGLDPRVVKNARVKIGEGVSGWVAEQRRPVCVTRPDDAPSVAASSRPGYKTGTFLSVPLEGANGLIGVLNVTEPLSSRPFEPQDCRLLLDLADRVGRAWERTRSLNGDRVNVEETSEALRRVIEHLRSGQQSAPDRVRLATEIARELNVGEDDMAVIGFAAAVHDVGMTLIGDDIRAQRDALSPEERSAMQRHVELGAELLHRIETVGSVRDVVMSHHEWWDGSGYPQGLKGADIPLGARVLAVVDAFESMTLGRAHRPAQSQEAAHQEIVRHSGSQFDPDVVAAFERVLPRFETCHRTVAPQGKTATIDAGR